MWVTKLLIPVKKRIFCPKTTKFGPKLAFLVNLGQAMQAYSMPCCGSVGGCGARAVSRKTPIYFMGLKSDSDCFLSQRKFVIFECFPECLLCHNVAQRRYSPLGRLYCVKIPTRRIDQSFLVLKLAIPLPLK